MQPKSPFTQPFEKLPETLPIYPLDNALLPGGELPLEIFEPRYLNLINDSIKSHQLIGMVQPIDDRPEPALHDVGCAGRIRQYRERKSGRIDVMLSGVCRYRIIEELSTMRGYRLIRPDWSRYSHDYDVEMIDPEKVLQFNRSLRAYFDRNDIEVDWDLLQKLEVEEVVSNLVLILKLASDEKQLLLESPTVNQRLDAFKSILEPKNETVVQ